MDELFILLVKFSNYYDNVNPTIAFEKETMEYPGGSLASHKMISGFQGRGEGLLKNLKTLMAMIVLDPLYSCSNYQWEGTIGGIFFHIKSATAL